MKTLVLGVEISEGTSKKDGKPYSIGVLHVAMPLAPSRPGTANVAAGAVGQSMECDPALLRPLSRLSFPTFADVEASMVVRYGKPVQQITDVKPMASAKASA